MIEWIAKIAEILKLPFKYVWVLFLASGALLFFPKHWLKLININSFRKEYPTLIGFVFFLSTITLAVNLCIMAGKDSILPGF